MCSMKIVNNIQVQKEFDYLNVFPVRLLQNVCKEAGGSECNIQTGFFPLFSTWNTQAQIQAQEVFLLPHVQAKMQLLRLCFSVLPNAY